MELKLCFYLFSVCIFFIKLVQGHLDLDNPNHALHPTLYEEILNEELCEIQLAHIADDSSLRIQFLDAGIRTPRGILTGNLIDLGNYYQCLDINEHVENTAIEGKYCMIDVPLNQEIEFPSIPEIPEWPEWPELPWPELFSKSSRLSDDTLKRLQEYNMRKNGIEALIGTPFDDMRSDNSLDGLSFSLAVCIPKPCTTQRALETLYFNMSAVGLQYQDSFCRIPNDKPWVAADYVGVSVFSFIGLLTLLSTFYDIRHTIFLRRDPKKANVVLQSFSLYTNTRRLLTFTTNPGALECLDGVRAIAMMWVIVGHTFSNQTLGLMANPLYTVEWMISFKALWISSAPITVDTFFMMSGLLIVYTTAGKMNGRKLLKNLHLFYLNRLLRMFPALAAVVLLQASLFNRVADGPYWGIVARKTEKCRTFWWSTLLHVQNYVNPEHMCLGHTWYLAIDVQLHILSPLVLFWVLGRKRSAWIALTSSLLLTMVGSTIYNFIMDFPAGLIVPYRMDEQMYYIVYYYVNTLTRVSPFIIGMIYGYMLHLNRGKKLKLSKMIVSLLWMCATVTSATVLYSTYPMMQQVWDDQTIHNVLNSFTRPAWTLSVGWLIFACVHGYGGPINWVLSLRMWKLPSRLSYAMYLLHYPLIFIVNSTALAPIYFSVQFSIFKFLSDFTLAMLVAVMVTLLVDSPFSTLIKLAMGGGPRRPQAANQKKAVENNAHESERNGENATYSIAYEGKTKL